MDRRRAIQWMLFAGAGAAVGGAGVLAWRGGVGGGGRWGGGVRIDVREMRRWGWGEVVARRDEAVRVGEVGRAAVMNGELARRAVERAKRVHDAWMGLRDERVGGTGLFPESEGRGVWNYRNCAADFFCFQFAIARRLGLGSVELLRETMARERAITFEHGLCPWVEVGTGKVLRTGREERLFGASEYLKDGLIGLYESSGDAEVLARANEIAGAIMDESAHASRFGVIPGMGTEMNGNVLQAFSRLAFAAGDERCAEFAARVAEAVVGQMLVIGGGAGGVPVKRFDYAKGEVVLPTVQLRDHGNEIAVGLSEVYAMAVARGEKGERVWGERADRWCEPIAAMYEKLFAHGVRADGLLVTALDGRTLVRTDEDACDNWGYLCAGALLFAQAHAWYGKLSGTRVEGIVESVERLAQGVMASRGIAWEGTHFDGYADTVESAIYVAHARPGLREGLLRWADAEIERMFACQREDGFVSAGYLDGNFIRTALMYADARSGGIGARPWSAGVGVGVCAVGERMDEWAVAACVGGEGESGKRGEGENARGWSGELVGDSARHAERLRLPWNWARINCWPEWGSVGKEGGGVRRKKLILRAGEVWVGTGAGLV